jgi:pimeloyl-ACP methyl ester carboxylesterase
MHEVRVESGGATLVGSYSPAGPTAVVAVHGAGEGTREWYLYRHLHDVLPPAGIGVLTFDRRGEGASTGDPSRGAFAVQADDAVSFANAIDAERVGLWGISQGSWVAPLAATRSKRIAFLVLLAATGVTPAAQMRYAVAEQIQRGGFGAEAAARAVGLREHAERWVRGEVAPGLAHELTEAAREPWWDLAFLPDALPPEDEAEPARRAIANEMFFEPEPVFAETRVPTLLFYGDDDSWTPVEPSIEAWRRARGAEVEIVVLAETGHEPCLPSGSISNDYEQKLVDWVHAHQQRDDAGSGGGSLSVDGSQPD